MSSGDEGDHSTFSSMQDSSCLVTPPGSQAPTVVGSVSDRSVDSDNIEPETGKGSECYEKIPSSVDQQSESIISEASLGSETEDLDFDSQPLSSFFLFRMSYLFVTLVVMLADGLQGTSCVDVFYILLLLVLIFLLTCDFSHQERTSTYFTKVMAFLWLLCIVWGSLQEPSLLQSRAP